ncbi:MAG: hypothetical protein DRN96_07835 [Thermoproteota archaeon]|nr:MAG: hypothetical protein DRN96_07835 [Candidatus Korarchaeota archaeon]
MLAGASVYAYANARSRALRSFMLTPANYDTLLRARSLPMMIQTLLSMPAYSQYARELMQAKTPADLEAVLIKDYYDKVSRVSSWVPERNARQLLRTLSMRFDFDNLKLLLRAAVTKAEASEVTRLLVPSLRYPPDVAAKLAERASVDDVIASVWDSSLRSLLMEAKRAAEELKSPLPLELTVDRYMAELLWRQSQQLPEVSKQAVRHLLGVELDSKAILACLRAKALRAKAEDMELIVPKMRYRLGEDLEKAMRAATLNEAMRTLAEGSYSSVLRGSQSLSDVERRLTLYMIEVNKQVFIQYPFQLTVVIAFLNLKYYEVRNVRSIAIGKFYELPPNVIRGVIYHSIT